jgi:L-alanine-DL-glutamate epimerase-like enolase superfamily enzyme
VSEQVRVVRVRVPFRKPFRTAAETFDARDSWLVQRMTEDGLTGWGEAVVETTQDEAVLQALLDDLVATGLPPAGPLLDRSGPAGRAFRAAYDGAGFDILALSDPLRDNGKRTVAVNAIVPASGPAESEAAAVAAVAAGFGTIKLKAGPRAKLRHLVAVVGAVRAAIGDEVAIRLDVNGTWDLDGAAERLRALSGFGLQYVEQPLATGDLAGAARLRALVGTRLAAEEAAQDLESVRAILDAEAADVLVVKPTRVGGPAAVGQIARLAADRGVPVVISTMFESGVGLALALDSATDVPSLPGWPAHERAHGLATADLLVDDLLRGRLEHKRGRMRAPHAPGSGALGVIVDEAAVRRYAVAPG